MNTLKEFFAGNYTHRDLGLLLVRLGVGTSVLMFHGYAKITGGPDTWRRLGSNMGDLGIDFAPVLWGFMAALAESVGALCLVLGVFVRPAALLVAATMGVAMSRHLGLPDSSPASGWKGASHALEILAVSLGLLAAGPGKYRLPWPKGTSGPSK